jgi:hypothetical protein
MPQISLPSNITFKYCVKEGEALKDVRGYLKNEEFIFKMDDGYNVLVEVLQNLVTRDFREHEWNRSIYFRMRPVHRQKDYILLNADNFIETVTKSFSLKSNQNADGGFKAHIFLYVKKPIESRNSGQRIRRAGHTRIQQEVERIRQFQADNPGNDDIGEIATAQWAQYLARQEPVLTLERPDNPAFNQSVRVDQMPLTLADDFVRIEIKFSQDGLAIPIWFNSSQLRLAFNLPPRGALRDYLQRNHSNHGDDQEDVDHYPDENEQ